MKKIILFCFVLLGLNVFSQETKESTQLKTKKVSVDNYNRAETDRVFKTRVDRGMLGKIVHNRELAPLDKQTVPRLNRDVFYSYGIFDLNSPLTITVPDSKDRFFSILVINEDHYIKHVSYNAGTFTFTKEEMGTRYIQIAFRTFANPNDKKDMKLAFALQDKITWKQKSIGSFEAPEWDEKSLAINTKALKLLGSTLSNSDKMFGDVSEVEPTRHLIGTAAGWGGNKKKDAIYVNRFPKNNDGKTAYTVTVKDVPVDGFWSVSLYNDAGYFVENKDNAYSINNVTGIKNKDGSITIHFGGDPTAVNYLPIMEGWNYIARLYRPRKEILDGEWTFPIEQIVK